MAATAVDYRSEWSRGLRVTGARISEIRYGPNHTCPMHWHAFPSLGIVLDGEISKEFSKSSVVIRANTAFSLPAGILHTDSFGPGSRVIMIEIDPRHPLSDQRLTLSATVFKRWQTFEDDRLSRLGQRLAREVRRPDGATSLALDGLVGEILSIVTRSAANSQVTSFPSWLLQAREIARNQLNRRVPVSEIADEVGVHPAYLARKFRLAFGVSPAEFARNARLAWAREQLIYSDLSISEIAIQAGFSDQSHFTRAFRRFSDQTPAQFRNFYREGGTR